MPTCEINKLYPNIVCDNVAAYNISIMTDGHESVRLEICQAHLDQLVPRKPATQAPEQR